MEYPVAIRRLSNHANASGAEESEAESFILRLYQANLGGELPNLEWMLKDILACLSAINVDLNGCPPSTADAPKANQIPRSVSCDVANILSGGWGYFYRWTNSGKLPPAFRAELSGVLLKTGIAWEAVLAGDVDDIVEHVTIEISARFE